MVISRRNKDGWGQGRRGLANFWKPCPMGLPSWLAGCPKEVDKVVGHSHRGMGWCRQEEKITHYLQVLSGDGSHLFFGLLGGGVV